AQDIYRASYY
nr:Chain C, Tyrosine-protein kinase receptor [Homo sapiens]6AT9_C Chain C, ALK [Homo sapiens]